MFETHLNPSKRYSLLQNSQANPWFVLWFERTRECRAKKEVGDAAQIEVVS